MKETNVLKCRTLSTCVVLPREASGYGRLCLQKNNCGAHCVACASPFVVLYQIEWSKTFCSPS